MVSQSGRRRGFAPSPELFFLILDNEMGFLAHSGHYILQFSCLLYAQNPAIYMYGIGTFRVE